MASIKNDKKNSSPLAGVASQGGVARAKSLSQEERSSIAKRAAVERWARASGLPRETHTGTLKLGGGIPCSVLDNGMRVFSVNGLARAFDVKSKGRSQSDDDGPPVPSVLAAANLKPFVSEELAHKLEKPITYRSKHGGRDAIGYEATIIRRMCDVLLDARAAGVLRLPQLPRARAAEALVRGFADVGVIALIDEATGYQDDRARDELQRLLEAYVVEDMRPWVGLFPNSFFRQIYRLYGWPYKEGVTQGPRYVGKFINKYVYDRLPTPVLERLRELNPVIEKRRKHKHHQFLTEDIGEPTVDRHLASVTTLMSVATSKQHFDDMFRIAFPKPGEQMLLGPVVNPHSLMSHGEGHEDEGQDEPEIHDSNDHSEPPSEESHDSLDTSDAVGGVRERVMAALQGGPMRSSDLAQLVYGDSSDATMSKLRVRLAQYKLQGIVETPSKGVWRLR